MADRLLKIKLDDIHVAEDNLRTELTGIQELADSIEFIGLLEPLRVQKNGDGYKLIAGHRRLAALRINGVHETQAMVQSAVEDSDRIAAMLIENMQRVDLDVAEQAEGVRRLIEEHGLSQAQLMENLGVSKQWIQDRIAILNVPESAFAESSPGNRLSVKHLALLGSLDEDRRERLMNKPNRAGVPTAYDIEDAWNKQMSKASADRLMAKCKKDGVLVLWQTELKKLLKAPLAETSGDDQIMKLILGAATEIGNNWGRVAPGECKVVLSQLHNFATVEHKPNTIYVCQNAGGYYSWFEVSVRKGVADDQDAEITELDAMYERNDARRKEYETACDVAEIEWVRTTKAADLIETMLTKKLTDRMSAFKCEARIANVLSRCDLEAADPETEEGVKSNKDKLWAYARKNASNLIRVVWHFDMLAAYSGRWEGVTYPDPPEYEGEDDNDDEDELDGI